LGESVAEGTIGKWLKQVGDRVEKFEPIVEVITDKVNAEVPSPFAGTLTAILVQEGETVPNNAEIAEIDGGTAAAANGTGPSAAAKAASPEAAPAPAPAPEPAHGPAGSDERPGRATEPPAQADATEYEGRLTPAVRRLAREHEVDLTRVTGTGHAGRITREDILAYVEAQRTGRAATSPAVAAPARAAGPAPSAAPAPAAPVSLAADSLKPQTPMRKAIAAQMTRALGVPVAYTLVEVDMSAVIARREAAKGEYQAREGMNLSFVAFVTKAAVEALRAHPDLNGHYTDEGHWRRKAINVGVAVAVDDGLVVPVIRDADSLSIHGLNRAINESAARARGNKLRLDDIQGGTFTVDNTGWTGSVITQPIINVPEVAILTMEAIVRRPVVVDTGAGEAIAIRPMMNMVLGFDHRATDGAQAGRFIGAVKSWLESVGPETPIW
ncbi:MAG TPA: dihydrolipoamide acetyltransferase family protein, partial [Candidatus Sulfotelmatobacter sp.]|nr:dihydrolipoamide acetyltransferase family protein [Candidatus Sulfotelmatobacter sp.]